MSLPQGFRPILAGVATLVLVAACGQSGAATSAPAASASPSAAASSSATLGPAEAYEVDLASDASVGAQFLVGEDGKTLYVFGKDSSGKSSCNAACAANWPPFTLASNDTVKAGSGVTGSITTIKRDDGTMQVAINGMPLYYFAGDTAKGQLNGEGIGGVWYAAGADGSPVKPASAMGSAAPGKSACVPDYYHACP